jgi:hypothetical protein
LADASRDEDLWGTIVASPLASAYVTELHSLAEDVVRLANDVFEGAPRPKTADDYLKVDHEIMAKLFALLGAAARISATLTDRRRRRDQSARQYEIQTKRVAWLRDEVLRNVKLERVLEPKVRHTLEHFDEYMDKTAIRYATGQIPTPSIAPIDFVMSRRRVLERFDIGGKSPGIYFVRVFIASERVFVNCGHEISVQALHDECRRIAKRLSPQVPRDVGGERGSSMLVITRETFDV